MLKIAHGDDSLGVTNAYLDPCDLGMNDRATQLAGPMNYGYTIHA